METKSVNGIQLSYDRTGGGKPPLMLIHGYPLDHSIWDDIAPLLKNDFDLILPDVRGFGGSSTIESAYTMTDIARDFASLLDSLGIEKAALAGHSMGGYVALAFARAFPERIGGLALVASQSANDTPERKEGRYKTAADVAGRGVQLVVDAMTDKLSPDQRVRDYVRSLIGRQGVAGISGALKAMAEREDLTSFIASFRHPLILIHGDADELVPIGRAREIKALVSTAHFIELAGVGHMPMMETPGQVAEALKLLK